MKQSAEVSRAPRTLSIHRGDSVKFEDSHPSEPGQGVRVGQILGPDDGASHLSIAIVELEPGGHVIGHRHPFEESFFVLEGNPLLAVADHNFSLCPQDFGLVPHAVGHAWSNPTDQLVRMLRVHAPQPRPIDGRGKWGVFEAPETQVPTQGVPVDELDPAKPYVGHFDQTDMAPPGSISMPGYHGANVQNVQIRMMVDDLIGARHHAMFIVQFTPGVVDNAPLKTAKEHFHPFEEIYYLISGQTRAFCDGEEDLAGVGDLVFAPVGASHGFAALGTEPLCWIEVQSPMPPASGGFTFHTDWTRHTNIG
ncbi:cupin domain-containing protein [Streptomyces sp. AS58]|uniref:cupin domain-containing protein n=1 Tax=Streptomyces sp. AS58 TaxID=1519489 RepID=UPI00099C35FB|nr:cupin domain-containing protein [Streptomyces sp. AS58]